MKFKHDVTRSTAQFSEDRLFRWMLSRRWGGPEATWLVCIGLNPSTADEVDNDPTVAGMIWRAQEWGYGAFVMLNAFAWRSTQPSGLLTIADPVGELNDQMIECWAYAGADIICAWGSGGAASKLVPARQAAIYDILRKAGAKPLAFKINADGTPKHPLYVGRIGARQVKPEPIKL